MSSNDGEAQSDPPADARPARPRRRRSGGVFLPVLLAVLAVLVIAAAAGGFYYFNTSALPASVAEAPAPAADAAAPTAAPAPAVPAPSTAAPSAAAPTEPAPAADAASAQPEPQSPAPATKLSAERFGGWFVVCPEGQPNAPTCFVQQQLHSAQSNALVFLWIMRRDEQGVIHSVWQTPPGLDGARGMLLAADDGTPQQVPIADCQPNACTVRGVFASAYLDTLASASRITATITMQADGRALRYAFDPNGMKTALDRLAGLVPPAPAVN